MRNFKIFRVGALMGVLMLLGNASFAQFDDVYYDPYKDGSSSNSVLKSYNQGVNNDSQSNDSYYDDDEYDYYDDMDDLTYTRRVQRFHRPNVGFNYYDPCYVDAVYYDPFWNVNSNYSAYGWSWRNRFAPFYYNRPGFGFGWGRGSFVNYYPSYGWNDPYYSPWSNSFYCGNNFYNGWGWNQRHNWNHNNGWNNNNYFNDNYKPKNYAQRRSGNVVASENGSLIRRGIGTDINNSGRTNNQPRGPRNERERESDNRNPTNGGTVRQPESPRFPKSPRPLPSEGNRRVEQNAENNDFSPTREPREKETIKERKPINTFGGRNRGETNIRPSEAPQRDNKKFNGAIESEQRERAPKSDNGSDRMEKKRSSSENNSSPRSEGRNQGNSNNSSSSPRESNRSRRF